MTTARTEPSITLDVTRWALALPYGWGVRLFGRGISVRQNNAQCAK